MYQKLSLRMRLGSASIPLNQLLNDVSNEEVDPEEEEYHKGIQKDACVAMTIAERSPRVKGITFVLDGLELFLAMNGRDFEL